MSWTGLFALVGESLEAAGKGIGMVRCAFSVDDEDEDDEDDEDEDAAEGCLV